MTPFILNEPGASPSEDRAPEKHLLPLDLYDSDEPHEIRGTAIHRVEGKFQFHKADGTFIGSTTGFTLEGNKIVVDPTFGEDERPPRLTSGSLSMRDESVVPAHAKVDMLHVTAGSIHVTRTRTPFDVGAAFGCILLGAIWGATAALWAVAMGWI